MNALVRPVSNSGDALMTWEWIPGAGLATAGSILSWWRHSAVTDAKASALSTAIEKEVTALRAELSRHEADMSQFRGDIADEQKELRERLFGLMTRIEVLATEQAAFIKVCTKTLEGLVSRQESHAAAIAQNASDVQVLKAGTGNQ
jgi:hypothetical protein